jgi:hypothetical protein
MLRVNYGPRDALHRAGERLSTGAALTVVSTRPADRF